MTEPTPRPPQPSGPDPVGHGPRPDGPPPAGEIPRDETTPAAASPTPSSQVPASQTAPSQVPASSPWPSQPGPAGHPQNGPQRRDSALPWKIATAGLALLTVALGGWSVHQAVTPAPTVTVTTTVQGADQPSPEPTEDPERDQFLLDLPRREEGDPRAKGPVDAPVVLTEWADFRCPYCSVFTEQVAPQLDPLVKQGRVRIEYRDMAIFGEDSVRSAAAARAAGEQGLFWEFSTALHERLPNEGHPPVDDALVLEVAREVGVSDIERFTASYQSEEVRKAVEAESAEAQRLGISSTPTFLVGTEVIPGAQPAEDFIRVIEEQAAEHG